MPKHLHLILSSISRPFKQGLMMFVDICSLLFAGWAAYSVRANEFFIPNVEQGLLLLTIPLIAIPIFVRMGMYRAIIRYISEQALWTIIRAVSLVVLVWTTVAFLMLMGGKYWEGLPRSIPFIFWLLATVTIAGSRFTARWILWMPIHQRVAGRQVLIYGAGDAGRQLAASLQQGGQLFPAGFLDDDSALHGQDMAGLRVYPPSHLPTLIEYFGIRDVIVTLPSSSQARRREVVQFLEQHAMRVRILPAMSDIANGKHLVNLVREVDIGDLLGRDPVVADPILLGKCITGKAVLITGAGGSIGSELCKQIALLNPERLVLLEQNEHALYQIERNLADKSSCNIIPILGSIKDRALLTRLFKTHAIETVYHAAAHKHVPLVEANSIEGIQNNVFGTWNVAETAFVTGVQTFVLVSTDKAVRPTNIMGATKRWAELIIQHFAQQAYQKDTDQHFCAVRFGNVLGSSGSVIPLFKEQIKQGGPITVTHPDIIRYFMSIHEAVELVIQAGSMAHGGDIFLLDMGEPVKITALAHTMIQLAGHAVRDTNNPDGDIEIIFTGLRPGEKLFEELLIASSDSTPTEHPKIMRGDEPVIAPQRLEKLLNTLQQQLLSGNTASVRPLLMDIAGGDMGIPATSSAKTANVHKEMYFQ